MKKSTVLLIIGISTGIITFVMLGLGIFTAAFLDNILINQEAKRVAMQASTYSQWGQVPGSVGINVTRQYTFYNFTNPFEVFWFNQTPVFTQMPGQLYQESQNFIDPTYNSDIVNYGYQLIIDELNPSPLTVTTLNVGPLGYWYTAKNLPAYQIAFYGLVSLVLGLDENIITRIQAAGVQKTCFISSDNVIQKILTPLGVADPALQDFMWNDPVYGMGNAATLTQWVLAITQGPDSDSAYILGNYFYLTYDQLTTLFQSTGDLATCLTNVNKIIQSKYTCKASPCDGNFLFLDQWTTQGITENPAGDYFIANDSVGVFNASIDGYVEISSFLTNYFLVNEPINQSIYQGVTFDPLLAASLLNVTPTSGNSHFVNTEPNTLVNIANLDLVYRAGEAFDATNQTDNLSLIIPIANQFNLPSLQHAHVLWKYVQYFEQEFLVRQSKSGTTADLFAGQIFSSTLATLFNLAQEGSVGVVGVPHDLTSQILLKFLQGNNTDCQTLFTTSASTAINATQIQNICQTSIFSSWDLSSVTDLYLACIRPNGPGYSNIVGTGGLTVQQLTTFCTTTGAGTYSSYASAAETYLKKAYGCAASFTNVTKCSNRELLVMQWTSSAITLNPPEILKDTLSPSLTLSSWYPELLNPFEYQVAIQSLGPNFNNDPAQMQPLPYEMANSLLTYDALFNQAMVQRAFIAFNTQDWDWFRDVFFGVTPYNIISYIRFTTVESAFEGFGQTRDAHDLLWTYKDKFLLNRFLQQVYNFGDPSINYKLALAGQNCTADKPTLFNASMYTGVNDSSLTRQFYSVNGNTTTTYKNTFFNGNIVTTEFDSPWAEDIPLQGTDGRFNSPGLETSDTVSVYLSNINYIGELSYDSTQEYSDLDAYRFMLPKSALQNKTNNPDNAKWFSDRWDGLLNLSVPLKGPFFVSKGHMLDVDPSLPQKFVAYNDSTQQYNATPSSADDTYLDIEPYSGETVSAMMRLQLNLEVKPDSLIPNPNYYMLPIMLTERGMNFTSSQIEDTFGGLMSHIKFKKIGIPLFFALFAVFLGVTIFVFIKRKALIKRNASVHDAARYQNLLEEGHSKHLQNPPDQSEDNSRAYPPHESLQSGDKSREVP